MDDTMRDSLALLRGRHRGNAKLKKALKLYVVLKVTKAVVDYCEEQQEAQKRRRKRRRVWVEPYLQRRMEQGHYNNLMEELANEAPELFKNYTRTSKALFDEIVERVTPHIKKQTTWWRDPLEPGLRVAITLRFLATGDATWRWRGLACLAGKQPQYVKMALGFLSTDVIHYVCSRMFRLPLGWPPVRPTYSHVQSRIRDDPRIL